MIYIGYLLLITVVSYLAFKRNSLTKDGGIAAIFVGVGIAIGFGYKGLLILGVFFVTSSSLSKFKKKSKKDMEAKAGKGSRRDAIQVLANGGAASIVAIIFFFHEQSIYIPIFAVLLAAANSDTWSSEIGSLSKKKPISLRSFKRIDTGSSGAVSLLGSVAGIVGSFFIAISSYLLFPISLKEAFIVFVAGCIGNIIDTLLGAFLQAEYQCTNCHAIIEKVDHCGMVAKRMKGLKWMNNDVVNTLSGISAAVVCYLFLR